MVYVLFLCGCFLLVFNKPSVFIAGSIMISGAVIAEKINELTKKNKGNNNDK